MTPFNQSLINQPTTPIQSNVNNIALQLIAALGGTPGNQRDYEQQVNAGDNLTQAQAQLYNFKQLPLEIKDMNNRLTTN